MSEESLADLKSRVQARYPDADISTFKVDERNFRPNIAIKGVPCYAEDTFMEMRIGNCLLRNIGPTFRCNDVITDYQNNRRNPENEPLQTLGTYRTLPLNGVAFGVYYKMEIV